MGNDDCGSHPDTIDLSDRERDILLDVLENPKGPNEALLRAARRRKEMIAEEIGTMSQIFDGEFPEVELLCHTCKTIIRQPATHDWQNRAIKCPCCKETHRGMFWFNRTPEDC